MLPSVVLQKLHDTAPEGRVTVGWAMGRLEGQSFGLILLLLAVVAAAPGLCSFAGILLVVCAAQMIVGRSTPFFPQWITARPLPSRRLGVVVPRLVVVLRFAERAIHPRWRKPSRVTRLFVGLVIMVLSVRLLLVPVPFSNVLPAAIMALISLAYLEEDGLFLSLGLLAGLIMIGIDAAIMAQVIRNKFGH